MTYPYGFFHPEWFLQEKVQEGLAKIGGNPEPTSTPRIPATQVVTATPVTPRPPEGAKMVPPDRQVTSSTTPVLLPGSMDTGRS